MISLSLFTPDLDLYDLNRVEVLRGPQGTLFGSGSRRRHGALHQQPAGPDATAMAVSKCGFDRSTTAATAAIVRGDVQHADVGDTRGAARGRLLQRTSPGFIDAARPGGTCNEDVNGGKRTGGRAALRWEPTDNIDDHAARHLPGHVDMDGYNREDVWNMLANPFTTTEPAVTLSEREQYTQLAGEIRRRVHARPT